MPARELLPIDAAQVAKRPPVRKRPVNEPLHVGAVAPNDAPLQTKHNTCDLRGLRVDDGIAMATTFLDRALGQGEDVVFLLHGHGTGALRDAIREHLSTSSYVANFRGAPTEAGGDGVTVVWLS